MNDSLFNKVYNPDVLSCLANLSNDEVFTPPEIVNQMLDMLPQELFQNPDTKFLDPACKTGVFLREIAKRLIVGLERQFPDLQQRIDHIFHNQLYGIAITELTSLLSRRGVYCSKYPNSDFSVSKFDSPEGNIRYKRIPHEWKDGKCIYCGANKSQYDRGDELETHAYEFIHIQNAEELFSMKFDVIIGNPPYQISDGGGTGSSAKPIYHLFIEQAKKLRPRYLSMIIPARWYSGGKGLDEFRQTMLTDKHIRQLYDFFNAEDCFPGVDLSGGVCYFLWDRDNEGICNIVSHDGHSVTTLQRPLLEEGADSFVRFNQSISILRKIQQHNEESFATIVSTRKPFGIEATDTIQKDKNAKYSLPVYAYPNNGYISPTSIRQNDVWVDKYKVYISKAYGERGDFPYFVLGKPFVGDKGTCCTETYLVIGASNNLNIVENIKTYITCKFFRFLVLMKKNTQNAAKNVYTFVPLQDFSKSWTDEELYAKYNLTQEEIDFIESIIKPME